MRRKARVPPGGYAYRYPKEGRFQSFAAFRMASVRRMRDCLLAPGFAVCASERAVKNPWSACLHDSLFLLRRIQGKDAVKGDISIVFFFLR